MKKITLALVAVFALGIAAFGSLDVVRALTVGWVQYLARVVPSITWDYHSIILGVVAFVLFTVGVHWLGCTWARSRNVAQQWRWGYSSVISLAIVAAFAAGICMIGVVHQTSWLARADEPMIIQLETVKYFRRSRPSSQMNLRMAGIGFVNSLEGNASHAPPATPDTHSWVTTNLVVMFNTGSVDVHYEVPWNDPKNRKNFAGAIPELVNPSLDVPSLQNADGYGLAHYSLNCCLLENGYLRSVKSYKDGTSNTLAIGEVNANFRPWADPANVRDPARGINRSAFGFGGPPGTGGALFAMADGSVRFISEKVSPEVLKALGTPDGGEVIDGSVLQER